MAGESDFNKRICGALNCYHAIRIEDMYSTGIPDINFTGGWIESKDIPATRAPKRADTIVRLDHYTPQQRAWHMRRTLAGGKVYVALEVADAFFLFDARMAAAHLGVDWTLADLSRRALIWSKRFDGIALRRHIKLDCRLP